jgi:hypothetical protein
VLARQKTSTIAEEWIYSVQTIFRVLCASSDEEKAFLPYVVLFCQSVFATTTAILLCIFFDSAALSLCYAS